VSDCVEADMAGELQEVAARAAIVGVCLSYLLDLDRSCTPQEAVGTYPLASVRSAVLGAACGSRRRVNRTGVASRGRILLMLRCF
jgi:hypothetical protein